MKNFGLITTLLILFFATTYVKGQDRIITTQNDTILCRIIYVSPTRIAYVQDKQAGEKGGFIAREQVKEYSQGSALPETSQNIQISKQSTPAVKQNLPETKQTTIIAESKPSANRPTVIAESMPNAKHKIYNNQPEVSNNPEPAAFLRWRVGIQGGGGYLFASPTIFNHLIQLSGMPQSKKDEYNKRLQNGLYFGADIHYMVTDFLGVGLNYSLYTASGQLNYMFSGYNFYYTVPPNYYEYSYPAFNFINEKSKYYVNYIGPSVMLQQRLGKKQQFGFTEGLSGGYIRYREEGRFTPYQYLITDQGINYLSNGLIEGNTWGGNIRLSFEYYPLPWLSVSINTGGFYAKLKNIKISVDETSDKLNLGNNLSVDMSCIDYFLGVCFHF